MYPYPPQAMLQVQRPSSASLRAAQPMSSPQQFRTSPLQQGRPRSSQFHQISVQQSQPQAPQHMSRSPAHSQIQELVEQLNLEKTARQRLETKLRYTEEVLAQERAIREGLESGATGAQASEDAEKVKVLESILSEAEKNRRLLQQRNDELEALVEQLEARQMHSQRSNTADVPDVAVPIEQAPASQENTTKETRAGVGLLLRDNHVLGHVEVLSVATGGPVCRSDVLVAPGDIILSIDGHNITKEHLTEVKQRIVGPRGTPVTIRFARQQSSGQRYEFQTTVVRETNVKTRGSRETTLNYHAPPMHASYDQLAQQQRTMPNFAPQLHATFDASRQLLATQQMRMYPSQQPRLVSRQRWNRTGF